MYHCTYQQCISLSEENLCTYSVRDCFVYIYLAIHFLYYNKLFIAQFFFFIPGISIVSLSLITICLVKKLYRTTGRPIIICISKVRKYVSPYICLYILPRNVTCIYYRQDCLGYGCSITSSRQSQHVQPALLPIDWFQNRSLTVSITRSF